MGLTKTEQYSRDILDLAQISSALAHPARVAILKSIIEENACICRDLSDQLNLSQATVSQHLKVLRDSGLITGTIEGPSMCYCIDEAAWKKAGNILGGFLQQSPPRSC